MKKPHIIILHCCDFFIPEPSAPAFVGSLPLRHTIGRAKDENQLDKNKRWWVIIEIIVNTRVMVEIRFGSRIDARVRI